MTRIADFLLAAVCGIVAACFSGLKKQVLDVMRHSGLFDLISQDNIFADENKALDNIYAEVLAAAQRWADDELRSLNAQIEYVLRDALRKAGRLPKPKPSPSPPSPKWPVPLRERPR